MNTVITLTETKLIKNPNTKTTYIVESKEVSEVTSRQHSLATCDDTVKWFRRLGGSETVERSYTSAGYLVTKLVSTSPDKQNKTVREYTFKTVSFPVNYDFENLSLYGKYQNLVSRDLMTDELKEKFATYKANSESFAHLNDEFNNLNK